ELVYYESSGYAPGQDLDVADLTATPAQTDAFFAFAEANFGRLRQWLLRPDTAGPFRETDVLAVRGSTWSFLRYAADRLGGTQSTLWSNLAFSPDSGLTNLASGLGTDPMPWFRDWAAAMYIDDAGAGTPAAIHTQPSWNFRDIYAALDYDPGPACSCAYQLTVRNPTNGVADSFSMSRSGAASYQLLGVAAGAFAGVTTTAPGANLAITVIRRE
ncbi:MAG TPA: hypothetical protein VEW03_02850, partial [Longimicrobiaceae bacterium]|nr:hypothetical protein [Longimicrobiaceae bacterium]